MGVVVERGGCRGVIVGEIGIVWWKEASHSSVSLEATRNVSEAKALFLMTSLTQHAVKVNFDRF